MKKLLILGGTYFQIPAIQYAKSKGYYVITCDYLPDNPGHRLADEYYNVSTTDQQAVLQLAQDLNIDGILCFASDPAAPTAAYVSEIMNLPGNSLSKIELLGKKNCWRRFLADNGFNTPRAKAYSDFNTLKLDSKWCFPIMVKPVDSSGSKGVTKVLNKNSLEKAFNHALEYSRAKMVIVEEFIERVGPQIGGDGYYGENKLEFVCFGDQVVDQSVNPYVPCGMKFPSYIDEELSLAISKEIEKAIKLAGLKNLSFNLEVMIGKNDEIYLMELGPRNGGNCIPEVIQNYAGVNLVALAVEASLGNYYPVLPKPNNKFYAYYALHSKNRGVYKGYSVSSNFTGNITGSYIFKNEGDCVAEFQGSNATIGILLLEFESHEDISTFFCCPSQFVTVNVG
ncbi:ATP-grasp domain-containing protein [Bacteroides sp.]|uniref:ATP-grasp domain-containing protein n=1 Tax=Bacteroides sp. TaxID=29523 RepID=UPI0025860B26|nr:ATP-grasp domain-containing protein [Bacteroides sp.]